MKRLIFTIFLSLVGLIYIKASDETLNYEVSYKWGLIQKDAGDVAISRKDKGDTYELKMVAKTRPWADRVYKVRDTLISNTKKYKYQPLEYKSISHEKNKYKRDDITFQYSGNQVKGSAHRYREDKKGNITESDKILEGTLPVYDMLSIYFFLRDIDYSTMNPDDTVKTTIFSGDKVEELTVKSLGKETVKLKDKNEQEAWHIQFRFTSGGGKKSSDDINCWISTEAPHNPLLIIGNLPIGQIRVNLVSN